MIVLFLLAFLFFVFFCCLSIIIFTLRNGIGPTPTSPKVKKELLEALPEMKGKAIFELGSGWGTLAISLAKKYPSCTVTAIENSPVPYFYSQILKKLWFLPNLHIEKRDFFTMNLRKADVVVCYLAPAIMKKLKNKFEEELARGASVVTHTFTVPGWYAEKVVFVNDLYKTPIYFYLFSKN